MSSFEVQPRPTNWASNPKDVALVHNMPVQKKCERLQVGRGSPLGTAAFTAETRKGSAGGGKGIPLQAAGGQTSKLRGRSGRFRQKDFQPPTSEGPDHGDPTREEPNLPLKILSVKGATWVLPFSAKPHAQL